MTPRTSILIEDPDLGSQLSPARVAAATRDCIARVVHLGEDNEGWHTSWAGLRFGIGLLVLEGLLTRRVGLEGRFGAELLGSGDLLRPWQNEDAVATLPHQGGWQVLEPVRVAVLDADFTLRLTRYPEVTSALFGRALRRSRRLAVLMAIVHQPRVDTRLHMLFWELADRWGTVGRDGVTIRANLTHRVLAELVGARRPSVSKALGELAEREVVSWNAGAWLLRGQPPTELHEVAALKEDGPSAIAGSAGLESVAGG